jgi:hypothetical protein
MHRTVPIWPHAATIEESLVARQFQSDFEVIQGTRAYLQAQSTQFFQDGIKKAGVPVG